MHKILACCVLFFLISGCSDDGDVVEIPLHNEVRLEVDGSIWTGSISSVSTAGGRRQLNAIDSLDNSSLQIFFPADTTGTFNIPGSMGIIISYGRANMFWSRNLEGSLVLDRNDDEGVSGSFWVTTTSLLANSDTLHLKNGRFSWEL